MHNAGGAPRLAQSRKSGGAEPPKAFVRFAIPDVLEFTNLNQRSFSVPDVRWSAAYRRKLQMAPRVCRSSSNASNPHS